VTQIQALIISGVTLEVTIKAQGGIFGWVSNARNFVDAIA
jgi:hypothetical protein